MKKSTKALVSLLLAAITALMLPLNALATTYNGSYGTITYSATVSGSTHSIYSYFGVSSNSNLTVKTNPRAVIGNQHVDLSYQGGIIKDTWLIQSYTYEWCYLDNPNVVPQFGHFSFCYYYDYINGHVVLNGAYESF